MNFSFQIDFSAKKKIYSKSNFLDYCQPFQPQLHKMVKHTQTIRRLTADDLFKCVYHFVELALIGLKDFMKLLRDLKEQLVGLVKRTTKFLA